jgi:hypothetical protein
MNLKQREIIDQIFAYLKERFPEIELLKIKESPENSNSLWVEITSPDDEDKTIELLDVSAEKEVDILDNYGYHISFMPVKKSADVA